MFERIPFEMFTRRVGIGKKDLMRGWGGVAEVVSLRDLSEVEDVRPMPREYLHQLLARVRTMGGVQTCLYAQAHIETGMVDPSTLYLGQTFVERRKYQAILESFSVPFKAFCVAGGVARLGPMLAVGSVRGRGRALAHYLPPIVEFSSERTWVLLDGVHRGFLTHRIGGMFEAVIIERVGAPFPSAIHRWDKVAVVDEKPPVEKRFSGLKEELFRDLKHVGIDG